jgi:anti-sigma-K factor RskA
LAANKVNTREYIESGVLELYIYDQLSEAERREVEGMCSKYPEVKAELEAIQDAVNNYATSIKKEPDPALRNKILSQLDLKDAAEPKVIQMNHAGGGSSYRWLAAASVALFLISAGANLYLYNQYQSITGQLADMQSKNSVLADNNMHLTKQLTTISNDLTVVSGASNVKIELAGLPLSPAAKALIFWDKERKATYINMADLPPLALEKQYQLWAIVDGKPVDLGVLPNEKNQTALLKVKDVSEPQAFAITIEPKGGSVNPTMDQMVVLGKL